MTGKFSKNLYFTKSAFSDTRDVFKDKRLSFLSFLTMLAQERSVVRVGCFLKFGSHNKRVVRLSFSFEFYVKKLPEN